MTPRKTFWVLAAFLVLSAAGLRFWHLGYGLPQVYNADEPHHVNVAVSFGRGSLNPGVFKYPTLWMYVLFAAYGAYFLLWSAGGLLHSAAEFGRLFVREPDMFYLIARALAALCSLAGVCVVFKTASGGKGEARGLWAAALLAASPTLVVSAHAAKPDSLMFLLSAAAYAAAVGYVQGGAARLLRLSAIFSGLAVSAQYNAAPLAVLVGAAWWARRRERPNAARAVSARELAFCCLLVFAAFLAGTPYALLNYSAFLRDLGDHAGLNALGEPAGAAVLLNAAKFCGQPFLGAVLLAAGAARLFSGERPLAGVLLFPAACQVAFIAAAPEGAWERYLLAAYPAFAVVGAHGASFFLERLRRIRPGGGAPALNSAAAGVLVAVLLGAGFAESWRFGRELGLPDTRFLSTEWALRNVPEGETVLLDQEHAGPDLRMSREQARELYQRTISAGHARSRYYRYMLEGHPGGGYRIYRIARGYGDLHSGDWHVRWSSEGKDFLDLREGLSPALTAGVRYVALSSFGARPDRSPELADFFSQLETRGELLREFKPVRGVVAGPRIRIFRIGAAKG